ATVTTDINPSIWAQTVTITATVTPPGATGTVTFRDSLGSTSVVFMGNATLAGGTAQITKSNLFVGVHAIIARYNGDASNAATTSAPDTQVVNRASSTTSLTTDVNPSSFGQNVKLIANVTPGTTGRVSYFDGSTPLGTAG